MGTTADKLNRTLATKADLKAALIEKGQNPGELFSQYPAMVRAIRTSDIQLANITVTKQPTKTSYTAKETFDPAGMEVKAVFSNDAYKFVDNFTVEPSGALKPTDTKVKVKYTEFGVTAEADVAVTVAAIKLGVPTVSGSLTYTGSALNPTWSGYDSDLMSISGDTSGVNAGSYSAVFSLKDKVNYTWADGTTADKSVAWSIGKAQASITLDKSSVVLNGDKLTETVIISSVGMTSIMAMSSDMTVATVSLNGNVLTISSVNETTGEATIVINGEVDSNYNAPEYPSVAVSAEFVQLANIIPSFSNYSSNYSQYASISFVDAEGSQWIIYSGGMFVKDGMPTMPNGPTLQIPVGNIITCYAEVESRNQDAYIKVNGTIVVTKNNGKVTYDYIVNGDVTIDIYTKGTDDESLKAHITITEYYAINFNTVPNGTLTTTSDGAVGSTVTLTPAPAEGYIYGGATVTYTLDGVEQTITLDANTTTFTMPAADVTITPVWSEKPATVTITVVGDGTLYEGDNYGEFAEANITHNGIMYETPATFEATVGDIIKCYADAYDDCDTFVNKSKLNSEDYVVTGDAIIRLYSGVNDGNWTYDAYIYINEIPSDGFAFTIGNTSIFDCDYVAEIGMTWAEWCNSEYSKINTGSSNMVGKYAIDGDTVKEYYSSSQGTGYGAAVKLNGDAVKPTDVITANAYSI